MEAQKDVTYKESSCRLTWTINNFSSLDSKKLDSEIFYAGGYKWRILIYPKGNNKKDFLSIFLQVADFEILPHGWSKHAKFSLSVISQDHKYTVKNETEHEFNANEVDWGYTSFIPIKELNDPIRGFLVRGACTVEAQLWLNDDQDKNDLKRNEKTDSEKPTAVETGNSSSSFAEFDTLFLDIQNLLEEDTSKSDSFSCLPPPWSVEEITNAKNIFEQCINIDLANVIQLGRCFELKKSLSILLSSNAFPDNMVDEITKFLANFDQSCEQYEVAQKDLRDGQEKEKSIGELKTTMKRISSEFLPLRNQAESLDRDIDGLERQLNERKARKAKLRKSLEILADQASTSKQALVSAEQDMQLYTLKKEPAEKVICALDKFWNSLKVNRSLML